MRNEILMATMATAALLMGMPALAAEAAVRGTVTVCVEPGVASGIDYAARGAQAIFADAGLPVRWISGHGCAADPAAILVTFETGRPASFRPDCLAYAFPYEGRHIVVLLDRVKNVADRKAAGFQMRFLTFVLAHEAGHQLEGVCRHSPEGIMKAHFGSTEIFGMLDHTLRFALEDIQLMQTGIDRRLSLQQNPIMAANRQ